ncbi:hypothetical protein BRADI_1g37453v3 [Brachypodium distachyon]|uniref:Uncharacterized protein n=1 Tax=Brachypodium distachyon TaxID=15368 RepID=A0A2K2DN74_BRADI|nr:hypothetical protein BRADI_1g37453v3 [Brachypodium distachyon]
MDSMSGLREVEPTACWPRRSNYMLRWTPLMSGL